MKSHEFKLKSIFLLLTLSLALLTETLMPMVAKASQVFVSASVSPQETMIKRNIGEGTAFVESLKQPGETVVTLQPAIAWQGHTYEIHYISDGFSGIADSFLFQLSPPIYADKGIQAFVVTRNGDSQITDPALLKDIFLLYSQAYFLYERQPEDAELSFGMDLGLILNNPLFWAVAPAKFMSTRRQQTLHALRSLLVDNTSKSKTDAAIEEVMLKNPKTVADGIDVFVDILKETVGDNQELIEPLQEVDGAATWGKNAALFFQVYHTLASETTTQAMRSRWLEIYIDALKHGEGSLDDVQLAAVADVLAEQKDVSLQKRKIVLELLVEEGVDRIVDSSDEFVATLGQLTGSQFLAQTVSSSLVTVGIALSVNKLLYGADGLAAAFRQTQRAAELYEVFQQGRIRFQNDALDREDIEPYDGESVTRFSAAWALERSAEVVAIRAYAEGIEATGSRPNLARLLHALLGPSLKEIAAELRLLMNQQETDLIQFAEPDWLPHAVELALVRTVASPLDAQSWIAYYGVDNNLWATDPAGNIHRRMTDWQGYFVHYAAPTWSTTGEYIVAEPVFVESNFGRSHLVLVKMNGETITLTDFAQGQTATWSQDGKKLAFIAIDPRTFSWASWKSDVWIYDTTSNTVYQATFSGGMKKEVEWILDDAMFVYNVDVETYVDNECDGQLFAVDVDSLIEQPLGPAPSSSLLFWDGEEDVLSYRGAREGCAPKYFGIDDLFLVQQQEGDLVITDRSLSPNGLEVAYGCDGKICVSNIDGTDVVTIAEGSLPAWQPVNQQGFLPPDPSEAIPSVIDNQSTLEYSRWTTVVTDTRTIDIEISGEDIVVLADDILRINANTYEVETIKRPVEGFLHDISVDSDGSFWLASECLGALRATDDEVIEAYNAQDGLGESCIMAIAATPSGIWAGAWTAGLNHSYDPVTRGWQTYFPDQFSQFSTNTFDFSVNTIAYGLDGSLWIGTLYGDIYRYASFEWQHYDLFTDSTVNAIDFDQEGSVWIATDAGPFELTDRGDLRGPEVLKSEPSTRFQDVATGSDNSIWYATDAGVLRLLPNGDWEEYPLPSEYITDTVNAISVDTHGVVWAGSTNWFGLLEPLATPAGQNEDENETRRTLRQRLHEGQAAPNALPDLFLESISWTAGSWVNDLWVGEDEVWAATEGGALHWDLANDTYQLLTHEHGLPNNRLVSVNRTEDGSVWFGTLEGLIRFDEDRNWTYYLNGPSDIYNVHDMTVDDAGNLWVATSNGVAIFPLQGLPRALEQSLRLVPVQEHDLSEWMVADLGRVTAISADGRGGIWIALPDEVLHLSSNGLRTEYNSDTGLASNPVTEISVSSDGTTWLAHERVGLSKILPSGAAINFNEGSLQIDGEVMAITANPDGSVWLSLRGAGLVKLMADDRLVSYTDTTGNSFHMLAGLVLDSIGNLWAPVRVGGWNWGDPNISTVFFTIRGSDMHVYGISGLLPGPVSSHTNLVVENPNEILVIDDYNSSRLHNLETWMPENNEETPLSIARDGTRWSISTDYMASQNGYGASVSLIRHTADGVRDAWLLNEQLGVDAVFVNYIAASNQNSVWLGWEGSIYDRGQYNSTGRRLSYLDSEGVWSTRQWMEDVVADLKDGSLSSSQQTIPALSAGSEPSGKLWLVVSRDYTEGILMGLTPDWEQTMYSSRDGSVPERPRALTISRDGKVWVAGEGLSVLDTNGRWSKISLQGGPEDIQIDVITVDENDGTVWVGTDQGAYWRDTRGDWYHHSMVDGLASDSIIQIVPDSDSVVWFVTDDGITRLPHTSDPLGQSKDNPQTTPGESKSEPQSELNNQDPGSGGQTYEENQSASASPSATPSSSTANQPVYIPIDISLQANSSTREGYVSSPTGQIELGGIVFELPAGQNSVTTQASSLMGNPTDITLFTNIRSPSQVSFLLTGGNVFPRYAGRMIGYIGLEFESGAGLIVPLTVGENLREWKILDGSTVSTITDSNVRQVWRSASLFGGTGIIDKVDVTIPLSLQQERLTKIKVVDASASAIEDPDPALNLIGVTAVSAESGLIDRGEVQYPKAVVLADRLNVRNGDSTSYGRAGQTSQGDVLDVLARNSDSSWIYVCCVDDASGWVINDRQYVQIVGQVSAVTSPGELGFGLGTGNTTTTGTDTEPVSCNIPVDYRVESLYNASELGCPIAGVSTTWAAWQSFERGAMLWRQDTDYVYAFANDGSWRLITERWQGQAMTNRRGAPPSGMQAPVRGFGYIWESQDALFRGLGWAVDNEKGFCADVQPFERGFLLAASTVSSCFQGLYNHSLSADFSVSVMRIRNAGFWTQE